MSDSKPTGKTYWKSFEELSNDPKVMEQLKHEFPEGYDTPLEGSTIKRRTFMGLMAASMALAATACRRPEEEIVAYVKKPEYLIPGVANHFATNFSIGNFASGLLVRSREGRPVKIEGNDLDPISGGSSSVLAQASLLSLYDPDRILRPTVNNADSTPLNTVNRMAVALREAEAKDKQVRIIVDEHASPSLAALFKDVERVFPNAKVVTWPNLEQYGEAEANKQLLGIDGIITPDLEKADTIVGIDSDFLGSDPEALYHIRQFAKGRKPSIEEPAMNRYYAVEAGLSASGANADYRVRIKPGEFNEFLLALLHELVVVRNAGNLGVAAGMLSGHDNPDFKFIEQIATDLLKGNGVVMTGKHLPAETHALGVMVNYVIGAYGTDKALNPANVLPYSNAKTKDIAELKKDLKSGNVRVAIFADVNPVYTLGEDAFSDLTSKVLHKIHFGLYADETSKKCQVYMPVTHYLEQWGDARMIDGSRSISQPLIAPLNENQPSLPDALMMLMKAYSPEAAPKEASYYEYVKSVWRSEVYPAAGNGKSFDTFWNEALRSGTVSGQNEARSISWNGGAASTMVETASKVENGRLMCGILPHIYLRDGKYANLGWLLELPEPITKVCWDNVAVMSQQTAADHGLNQEDLVTITTRAGAIELPAFIQPGMADGVVLTTTGFGRTEGGRVLVGNGTNAFELMPDSSPGYVKAKLGVAGGTKAIATTQNNNSLGGEEQFNIDRSNIVRDVTLADFMNDPDIVEKMNPEAVGAEGSLDHPISLVPDHDYSKGHRWAMTIDASACVGCSACVVSCQSENNIPVVGKEQVIKGREMQWLRIDRYYSGKPEEPNVHWQPMLCQHCEAAPCENVCPVAATTHSPEGLNEMTYNRCVGTRYCSNNCPYKVRRFNFLKYHTEERDPHGMVFNPDVTVRMRGVMEKCTFCVQRINEAKYHAKNDGRELVDDGEVRTACQTACPADAITFGNINDKDSAVSKSRTSDRGYLVLREMNTRPMVTYLAKIRNKNGVTA